MRRKSTFLLALCVAFAFVHLQGAVKVGDKVNSFSLVDVRTGQEVSLDRLAGPKGVAVIFIATECPYSNAFNKIMASVAKDYKSRGIHVVGVNSNNTEPAENVKQHAETSGLDFTVLKDNGSAVADKFGAQRTPEVFLLDKDMVVRYHGTIGNSKLPTTKAEQANADDLLPALDAVLSGQAVPVQETKAFGCTIKR